MTQTTEKPIVIIGDGWSALGAVGFLALTGAEIRWITATGARMTSPLPMLEAGTGAEAWQALATALGIDCGEIQYGSYIREFRNKAFREPAWTKAPTPEARRDVRNEVLWAPERRIAPAIEARFSSITVAELEEEIRKRLIGEESQFKNIQRLEEIPVTGFRVEDRVVRAVILGTGQEIECSRVIYADRWPLLGKMTGLPKPLAFLRKREPMGILQATFYHESAIGVGLLEGFFSPLHKEAGEEMERNAWGYFSSDGMRSFWTLCLSAEEGEDNHQIAKRLRRMKNALDKMFTGSSWLPEGKTEFMSVVKGEQVRFEEAMIFAEGDAPIEPITLSHASGIAFITDGYGPASAMEQAGLLVQAQRPYTETKDLNPAETGLA